MRSLDEYQVSGRTGFVLERPCVRLPPAWRAYESLADSIGPLLSQPDRDKASADYLAAVAGVVEPPEEAAWPEIEAGGLEVKAYLHLCLTCAAAAYLWHRGESSAPGRLPAQLARPLHRVSESLGGLRPTVGHATLALANCALPAGGWSGRPEDLRLLQQPGPSPAFRAFLLVTCAFELDFAPAVPLLIRCADSRSEADAAELLGELADRLTAAAGRFEDFGRLLEPDDFYRDVRPYLSGHDGLVFEGVSETPRRLSGGSAAQSTMLHSVDALLGVRHESEFMADMVNYMHPAHRLLLSDLATETRVPELVRASPPDSPLRGAHSRAQAALAAFRTRHMGLVSRYIVAPAGRVRTEFASLAELGTGGQPLIRFLRQVRDEGLRPPVQD